MNFMSNLFEKVELEEEDVKELTYGFDTYGKRVEIIKKIIAGGNQKQINKAMDLIAQTMLKQADAGPQNINSTNTAIAECAQAMVAFGQPAIDPLFKILEKVKNRQVDLFPQTIQRMCCAALAAIGDPSVLPRLQRYVDYIKRLPTVSDVFVLRHAQEALGALEGAKLLQDIIKDAQQKK